MVSKINLHAKEPPSTVGTETLAAIPPIVGTEPLAIIPPTVGTETLAAIPPTVGTETLTCPLRTPHSLRLVPLNAIWYYTDSPRSPRGRRARGSVPTGGILADGEQARGSASTGEMFAGGEQARGSVPMRKTLAGGEQARGSVPTRKTLAGSGRARGPFPTRKTLAGDKQTRDASPTVGWMATDGEQPKDAFTTGVVCPLNAIWYETDTIPTLEKGIETHGIERVPPATRAHVHIFDNFTMWFSANLVLSTVVLGALANVIFGLGFWDSLSIIIVFNALGILPVAFFSTLGPRLGLRQMTISRFSFGWVGAIIMALFNVAACIGWSAVNVIIGSQLIAALSGGVIPAWTGILMIAALTTAVSIYGYKYVHGYERYAWFPMAIIFIIMLIVAAPNFQVIPTPALSAASIAGLVSFGAAIFGFATGWSSYAADYSVNQPEETPTSRIFWLTFLGIFTPCVLLETLGVLLTSIPDLQGKLGGDLLAGALDPLGTTGKLIVALLALSIIANNIPNDYSLGLSMQVLGKWFQGVNRAVWTLIGAVLYIAIALFAGANFGHTLEGFLLIIAYWLGPWAIILILEHFVFRRGKYNVDDWDTPGKLPIGWAAIVSMAIGLGGTVLGAAQVINNNPVVGPIANLVNPPFGMDVGFELGLVLAGIAYLILRPLELKATQR